MKKTKCLLITTYNRRESLIGLIKTAAFNVNAIFIIDDCSNYNVAHEIQKLKTDNDHWPPIVIQRTQQHNGKQKYYKTVSQLFKTIAGTNYDYYFMIPDDMRPVKSWTQKAITTWESIDQPAKICLNIYSDKSRFMQPCWSNFKPQIISENILITQWTDMAFLTTKKFFELLAYQIPEPQIDWKANPLMSSGVGRYITRFLNGNNLLIFQTIKTLLIPIPESANSQMNKTERQNHPEINSPITLKNRTIVGIATIPQRKQMLERTIKSLLPQVDRIIVSLNNYTHIPEFLKHPQIKATITDNKIGDSYKFAGATTESAYFFTCDDDLIYPENYISYLKSQIIKMGYRALVSLHGRNMKPRPISHYYKDAIHKVRCLADYKNTTQIDVPGSGVSGWHTDFLKVDISQINTANMGDIWLAKFATEQNVPMYAIPHQADFLKYQHPNITIYELHQNSDIQQTQLYNLIK